MSGRYNRTRCPQLSIGQIDALIGDLQTLVEECKDKAGDNYYPNNLFQEGNIRICYTDINGRRQCDDKRIPMNLIDLAKRADECNAGNQRSCTAYQNLYLKLIAYMEKLTDALRRGVPSDASNIGIIVGTRCLPKSPLPGQRHIPGFGKPISLT